MLDRDLEFFNVSEIPRHQKVGNEPSCIPVNTPPIPVLELVT
jgi:hypothetical protein